MKVQGVILGIDAYEEGATLAARRNKGMTGIPFEVIRKRPTQLKSEDFAGYAKLFVFENFDADVVVYLDADLVLLKPWDMSGLIQRPELVAVKDQFMDRYPHWDPEVDRARYFNSGFFVANRENHAGLFQHAAELWRDGRVKFGLRDQSALNHAVLSSCAPLHLIDERFNYLRYHIRPDATADDVVGAHYTPHGYTQALAKLRELEDATAP